MFDIFNIPMYYISFKPNITLEKNLHYRGFFNVNHFPAIDGRKMDINKLLYDNTIGIRAYNDILFGRDDHSGLPTLGAVGCTMSHCSLWNYCIDMNLPYIFIVEEDIILPKLNKNDIENIQSALYKENGIFISSNITRTKNRVYFMGTHCYFITQNACRKLVEKCFPIQVQTDFYLAHMATIGDVNVEGYKMASQTSAGLGTSRSSSIQKFCAKCILPKNITFYISILIGIIILIIICIFISKKFFGCSKKLSLCRSSGK
jgi:GR25 family glycosyltransferase involved in LPS biosynthesis